jgi:hypothetical protein
MTGRRWLSVVFAEDQLSRGPPHYPKLFREIGWHFQNDGRVEFTLPTGLDASVPSLRAMLCLILQLLSWPLIHSVLNSNF